MVNATGWLCAVDVRRRNSIASTIVHPVTTERGVAYAPAAAYTARLLTWKVMVVDEVCVRAHLWRRRDITSLAIIVTGHATPAAMHVIACAAVEATGLANLRA
jgi:hypothetical protein